MCGLRASKCGEFSVDGAALLFRPVESRLVDARSVDEDGINAVVVESLPGFPERLWMCVFAVNHRHAYSRMWLFECIQQMYGTLPVSRLFALLGKVCKNC
jgi:hypothetical protein